MAPDNILPRGKLLFLFFLPIGYLVPSRICRIPTHSFHFHFAWLVESLGGVEFLGGAINDDRVGFVSGGEGRIDFCRFLEKSNGSACGCRVWSASTHAIESVGDFVSQ